MRRAGTPDEEVGQHKRQSGVDSSTMRADQAIALKTNRKDVLVIDVGGTSVKVLATGQNEPSEISLGASDEPRTDGLAGLPRRTKPGYPIDTTSYFQSLAICLTPETVHGSDSISNRHLGVP
jgi:hypothetical protein